MAFPPYENRRAHHRTSPGDGWFLAVLFITHDLSLLLELADRIAVMYAGHLMEVGSAQQLHHAPAHPYTMGLLNSFPSLHGSRRELAGIPGSPPDLRNLGSGCPFIPRCGYASEACEQVPMTLAPVRTSNDFAHVTSCPFVTPETPPPASAMSRFANSAAPSDHPEPHLERQP